MTHQLSLELPVPLTDRQQAIYGILFEAAENGDPCPTNIAMAAALRCCVDHVSDDVVALSKLGMIARQNLGIGRRRVEIIATGKVTQTEAKAIELDAVDEFASADKRFAAALKGRVFDDHPKARPNKYPKFYPARHQAVGHEAMC